MKPDNDSRTTENPLHAADDYTAYQRAARAVESVKFALIKHDKMLAEHEIKQIGRRHIELQRGE